MRRVLSSHRRRAQRAPASLPAALLVSSLLTASMGLAADQHTHYGHGNGGEASADKVIYREGGSVLHDRMMEEVKRQQESIGQKGGYSTGANSHMLQQGVLLVAEDPTKVFVNNGQRCPSTAPVKDYHVSAINIEITLSRFLDYFPGYMYVLTENVEKARSEEAANRAAREKENDPGAVSNGLQGDVIQPLVIRANQGDCLKLTLHNDIKEEASSLIINGSSMVVSASGKPATPSDPDATVPSGGQQSFEWYIKPDTQEGARFFRSHTSRDQFNQGLIGMLVVEPRGSRYLSPFDGKPMASGWEVMIEDPNGADFREFAIFYHEAGDEAFRLLNKKGEMLPQRDPHTDSYRPGARLLNYRSEPHGTRIELQAHMGFYGDESMAYGSYTFGDPATTIPRSYLGDPAKFRMAGGSEIVHSHHLHGGSIRWARQPGNSNLDFAVSKNGPVKFPPISDPSDRLDVQSIGPTEVYDQVIEGGSGDLQALAGEFVFAVMVDDAAALDFSAERIVQSGKSVVTAHVNAKDDRWRFEFAQPQGGASIVIVRMDCQSSWLILFKRRQYLEVPIATDHRLTVRETMEGELSREFVGDQTLNGYPTELFEVTVAENGGSRQYYQWVTKVQRFPVKTVSKQGKWSEEFRHLIFTEQSPFLFELPQRLDRANPPAETRH